MSDMPSAREHGLYDLRRKRAGVAMGIVLAVAVGAALAAGGLNAIALPVAAFLGLLAVPSWIGVEPRFPVPSFRAALYASLLNYGVPIVGVLTMFVVLNKGSIDVLALVPAALLGALIYSAYRWRYTGAAMATVRGVREGMPLGARLWRHYLGYAAGLAGGVMAAVLTREVDWNLGPLLFASVFLAGKAAVDLALPQPPLKTERLSRAGLQLAAMSPLWFGLPWGVALAVGAASTVPGDWSTLSSLPSHATTVVAMTVAAAAVFAAFALIAFLMEAATGDG